MQCTECHVFLPENARFCLQCGAAAAPPVDESLDPLRETLKVALGRQYEVLGLLGRGGMGAVYLARETALEREVAIKVLPPGLSTNRDGRERFRREARTAARLSHPNIVPLHTFGDVDGTMFYVMGYVRGESLAARLKREGRLDEEEARRILNEIASALEYAHGLNVVHRDIKPDNVLIEEDTGRALLTDFGVAKTVGGGSTMTALGSIVGTPHFMSPEQAQGSSDIDARSDLYSLGVMGYGMLAGRVPFDGQTTSEVLLQHITKEPAPLTSIVPDVAPEIAAAIARCLSKDREKRFADARTFRSAISLSAIEDVPVVLSGTHRVPFVAALNVLTVWYLAVWWLAGGDASSPFFAIVASMAGLWFVVMPLAVMEKAYVARKAGIGSDRVLFEMFRQPAIWTGRYPRRFRLAGDLWERLPVELRRARNAICATVVLVLVLMLPGMIVFGAFESHLNKHGVDPYSKLAAKTVVLSSMFLVIGTLVTTLVYIVRWDRHAKSLGLHDSHLRTHMLSVASSRRSFWLKPEHAVVLLPRGVNSSAAVVSPNAATEVLPSRPD